MKPKRSRTDKLFIGFIIIIDIGLISLILFGGIMSHASGWIIAGSLILALLGVDLTAGIIWAVLSPLGEEARKYEEAHPIKPAAITNAYPPTDFEQLINYIGHGIVLFIDLLSGVLMWFVFRVVTKAFGWSDWIVWVLTGLFLTGMGIVSIIVYRKIQIAQAKKRNSIEQKKD